MDTTQPPLPDDLRDTAQPLLKDHKDNTADKELHVMKSSGMDHSYCCLGDQPSINIDVSSSNTVPHPPNTVPHPPDTVPHPPDTRACVLCSKKGDDGIQVSYSCRSHDYHVTIHPLLGVWSPSPLWCVHVDPHPLCLLVSRGLRADPPDLQRSAL